MRAAVPAAVWAAARLYERAFAADPALADAFSRAGGHRYNAACYAARAARGDGTDALADPAKRAALRAKSLAWLQADLAVWQKRAAAPSGSERKTAASAMTHWLGDSDPTGTRGGLIRLDIPPAERVEWDKFWTDVKATLTAARKPPPPPEVTPPPRPKG